MSDFPNEHLALVAQEIQSFLKKELDCGISTNITKIRLGFLLTFNKTWARGAILKVAILEPADHDASSPTTLNNANTVHVIKTGFYNHNILFQADNIHSILKKHYINASIGRNDDIVSGLFFTA